MVADAALPNEPRRAPRGVDNPVATEVDDAPVRACRDEPAAVDVVTGADRLARHQHRTSVDGCVDEHPIEAATVDQPGVAVRVENRRDVGRLVGSP